MCNRLRQKRSSGWNLGLSWQPISAFQIGMLVKSSSCLRDARMKSEKLGSGTFHAEVANISGQGFWLFLGDRELFVPFRGFPWFKDAPVSKILNVLRPQEDHLYWPDLDVDLSVESIEHPERFPLVWRG